jgi:cell division protein FtsB
MKRPRPEDDESMTCAEGEAERADARKKLKCKGNQDSGVLSHVVVGDTDRGTHTSSAAEDEAVTCHHPHDHFGGVRHSEAPTVQDQVAMATPPQRLYDEMKENIIKTDHNQTDMILERARKHIDERREHNNIIEQLMETVRTRNDLIAASHARERAREDELEDAKARIQQLEAEATKLLDNAAKLNAVNDQRRSSLDAVEQILKAAKDYDGMDEGDIHHG